MSHNSHDEMQALIQQTMGALNALSQRIAAPDVEALLHPVDAELRLRRRRERRGWVRWILEAAGSRRGCRMRGWP